MPASPLIMLDAIANLREAQHAHLSAVTVAGLHNAQRPTIKLAAVLRIMQRTDVLPAGKLPSYSQADDLSRLDPEYEAFKLRSEDLAQQAQLALYTVETAKLHAEALIKAFPPNQE